VTLRVLYSALGDDYGDRARGPSFERASFEDTLRHMPVEMIHFDPARELEARGYWGANQRLWELASTWLPDVFFCVMFEEQMDRSVVARITRELPTTTVGWFCDDHWRFERFSRFWAGAFHWVVTTDEEAVAKYRATGQSNVHLSQWAVNHFAYHPVEAAASYDVTFVGQPYGNRRALVDYLRRHGVSVDTWGQGWPRGRLSGAGMREVFCASKVNLNFSASSTARRWRPAVRPQIKGRVFEVTGCGGLLLTEYAPGLEKHYRLGEEIVSFRGRRDMLKKVRWLLRHQAEREAIARAGLHRTLRDHTYEMRLTEMLRLVTSAPRVAPGAAGGKAR
jgi:spore maturation protein CgeB